MLRFVQYIHGKGRKRRGGGGLGTHKLWTSIRRDRVHMRANQRERKKEGEKGRKIANTHIHTHMYPCGIAWANLVRRPETVRRRKMIPSMKTAAIAVLHWGSERKEESVCV